MKAVARGEGLEKDAIELNPFLEEGQEHSTTRKSFSLPNRYFWPWIVHAILFSTALVMIVANLRTETGCTQKLSYYSPVLSLANEDHQTRRFNKSDHTFRGPPSESVSEAWDRLTQSMCQQRTLPKL